MKTKNAVLLSACVCAGALGAAACGPASDISDGTGTEDSVGATQELLIGDHLRGISDSNFSAAKASFATVETVDDGLGPIFNDAACGNCHNQGATGGAGTPIERR